ncbi:MAG: hypothetical protein H6755_01005 [Candidatus Omnitrophica bacterium]|nr:hypothetical protein [Candidatus Omnitrophota bacterium]
MTLITLIFCEGFARLMHLAPLLNSQYSFFIQDPYLPYKPQPFSVVEGRTKLDLFDYHYQYNQYGFRDQEYSLEKKPGVYRILGIGDSFTYGIGANFEDTFLRQLEVKLNNEDYSRQVEIIKAGIPGYFPEPERMLLEHYGVEFKPDFILVGFLANDIMGTHLGIDYMSLDKQGHLKTKEAQTLGRLGSFLYIHSHVARIFLHKYVEYIQDSKYKLKIYDVMDFSAFYAPSWEKIEKEFIKMIDLADSINAKIGFVYIPQDNEWTIKNSYPRKRLAGFCDTNNVFFIDVTIPMGQTAQTTQESLYWQFDGHCTKSGYKVIADTLYNFFQKKEYL